MPPKRRKKIQYFTIQFEKYLEIFSEVDRSYYILCDKIKDVTVNSEPDSFSDPEFIEILETFIMISNYRDFLDEKVNNPTEEEIEFTTKNNIKDILFNKEELAVMQQLWLELEARKQILLEKYNVSITPS